MPVYLDEAQVQPDLRPLLVDDSSRIDDLVRHQHASGNWAAPLPYARGAAYYII